MRYETFIPASGYCSFSIIGNNQSKTAPQALPLINPVAGGNAIFTSVNDVTKSLTFCIDVNNVFTAHVDGQLWITREGIKDGLTFTKTKYSGFEDPVAKNFFHLTYQSYCNSYNCVC